MENKSEKTITPGKKILAISIDFDGCLASKKFIELYQELLKKYQIAPAKMTYEEYAKAINKIPAKEYEEAIVTGNIVLFEHIKEMVAEEKYDEVVIMVGSNRTSAAKDQEDGIKNSSGSAFRAMKHFANALNHAISIPVTMNERLLYDSVLSKEGGYNFNYEQHYEKKQELAEQMVSDYAMSGDNKYRLSFFQIHDICANYSDCDVTYVHADDKDDIVTVSTNTYTDPQIALMLPANLAKASFLNYEEYNPIAELLRVQRELAILNQSNTTINNLEELLARKKEQIETAIKILRQDMNMLVSLTKEKQLDERTQAEVEKAQKIIANLPTESLDKLKNITTIKELDGFLQQINKVLNKNVRSENMSTGIKKIYEVNKKEIYYQRITEFGKFERKSGSPGYTIPQEHYDELATKCFKDIYARTAHSVETLQQIIIDSRCHKFDTLVAKLKIELIIEKKDNSHKWSKMIQDHYQEIKAIDKDKERAIKGLSNTIVTLREHIASGKLTYSEALSTLQHAVNNAIEKSQQKTVLGRFGVTHSNVALQLKNFEKNNLVVDSNSEKSREFQHRAKKELQELTKNEEETKKTMGHQT
ncbi:MAG: hypothetical protein QM652_13575 [Legionella sp.]|uniref:hypothetical protein n=1 Tax=Legionella sp. TaxID=459 RepID=UPI0039E6F5E4